MTNIKNKNKIKIEIKKIIAVKYFNNRCHVCHEKFGKGFAIHHVKYLKSEKMYQDFKNPDDYHFYLHEIIQKKGTGNFALLCGKHHFAVERLKRWEPAKLKRMLEIIDPAVTGLKRKRKKK